MGMFLSEGSSSSTPGATPASPEITSDDIALMQRVLGAAAERPLQIPERLMSYIIDYVQTSRLAIPIGQVFGVSSYANYTPVWTSTGTQPALGNAVVLARFSQIGKLVHAYGRVTFGSSTTFGTGNYAFSFPLPCNINTDPAGTYWGIDTSAGALVHGPSRALSLATFGFNYAATYLGTNTLIGAAAPWVWANTDQIAWNIVYEAA